MRLNVTLLAASAVSILLAGCGGGGAGNTPYDGTWQVTYPPLSKDSTITTAKVVLCNNPGGTMVIKDSAGTTTLSASCTTTTYDVNGTPTTFPPVTSTADIGINIVAKKIATQNDVMSAVVNGVTFAGECISTVTCSAVSAAGDTLGLTR